MKKLLGIVVLGLLWCNVANANEKVFGGIEMDGLSIEQKIFIGGNLEKDIWFKGKKLGYKPELEYMCYIPDKRKFWIGFNEIKLSTGENIWVVHNKLYLDMPYPPLWDIAHSKVEKTDDLAVSFFDFFYHSKKNNIRRIIASHFDLTLKHNDLRSSSNDDLDIVVESFLIELKYPPLSMWLKDREFLDRAGEKKDFNNWEGNFINFSSAKLIRDKVKQGTFQPVDSYKENFKCRKIIIKKRKIIKMKN